MTSLPLTLFLHAAALSPAQVPLAPPPDMVLRWNEVALDAIRAERTAPPMAARNLAIMHLAIYDAVNAIARRYRPYAVDALAEAGTSADAAAAAAAYHALVTLYPERKRHLDAALADSLADVPAGGGSETGVDLGRFVAGRIVELRCDDGSANAQTAYAPTPAPGVWERTPPRRAEPLYPLWGNVKPFAMRPGTQYKVATPPALTSREYTAAFREVKMLGGKRSTARSEEQTQIALFWADNAGTATPPGHWNVIAQAIARQGGLSLVDNARLFALLNMSLADAGIYCWLIKFHYGYWRPITAIHRANDDGNPDTDPDPTWEPLIATPPFPSYTSGHSTFSGAGASLLMNFFGTDRVRFACTSEGLPGVTRRFESIWSAAEEAGMSRIYGGIHWQLDNTEGLAAGKWLGQYVFRNYLQPREQQTIVGRPPIVIEETPAGPRR